MIRRVDTTDVRLSEFWLLAREEFGRAHAETLVADLMLAPLDATATEALEAGVAPRVVWEHLCDAMSVPPERRAGRDPSRRPAERTADGPRTDTPAGGSTTERRPSRERGSR